MAMYGEHQAMTRREFRRMQLNALRRTSPALLAHRYTEMAFETARQLPPQSQLGFAAMIETMLDLEDEQAGLLRREPAAGRRLPTPH